MTAPFVPPAKPPTTAPPAAPAPAPTTVPGCCRTVSLATSPGLFPVWAVWQPARPPARIATETIARVVPIALMPASRFPAAWPRHPAAMPSR
jgi:hypothetical protein